MSSRERSSKTEAAAPGFQFASDNYSPVHPEVMAAIQSANFGYALAYGSDPWTMKAEDLFRSHFGSQSSAFFVFNGTGANVSSIAHALKPWQAVICPESAHIRNDECGAPQASAGISLLTVKTDDGKLTPERCKEKLENIGFQHSVQPGAISISQTTELGTVYSIKELRALSDFAKENRLLFLMDGARICNAAAALQATLKEITADVGVDILSFGGTKNGLMGAEAVVFFSPSLAENFQYIRKQQSQLASKMRYLAAQFIALLEGDLWRRNALHANRMAQLMAEKLPQKVPHAKIAQPVDANAVFVQLPLATLKRLQEKIPFYIWDESQSIARWMTSWDTTPESIDLLLHSID